MNIFDFNIHLPFIQNEDVNKVIDNDMHLDAAGITKGFEVHQSKFEGLEGANFLLFNLDLFSESIDEFHRITSNTLNKTSITALIDFRRNDLLDYLEHAKAQGIRAIMVNSYLQGIAEADFLNVYKIFKFAEENDLIICIDGSYGTSKMYSFDNLKLACFAADMVSKVPIVIIHSGGLRVKEAMLLAFDKPNIYLDTSFSLPFYLTSSLEQDYAFAYKKIGSHRVVYGSDIPYLNSKNAIKTHLEFLEKYKFSDKEIRNIMCDSALNLLF